MDFTIYASAPQGGMIVAAMVLLVAAVLTNLMRSGTIAAAYRFNPAGLP